MNHWVIKINFTGLTGNIFFDENGDRIASYSILKFINGSFQDFAIWDPTKTNTLHFLKSEQNGVPLAKI